ncbi:MAG: DUF6524 family protein [Gammaproteobacteria bacterium]|nr:DUF6524 family protein [Gammaproteobacteria bacterium]
MSCLEKLASTLHPVTVILTPIRKRRSQEPAGHHPDVPRARCLRPPLAGTESIVKYRLTCLEFFARVLIALPLVFTTYNPTGYSFYHWVIDELPAF